MEHGRREGGVPSFHRNAKAVLEVNALSGQAHDERRTELAHNEQKRPVGQGNASDCVGELQCTILEVDRSVALLRSSAFTLKTGAASYARVKSYITSIRTHQGSLRHNQRVSASDAAQNDLIGVGGVAPRPLSRQRQRQQATSTRVRTEATAGLTCALKTASIGLPA